MEPFLLDMALKGAVVLALTGAFAAMARSASASLRHLVWSIGLAAALALPLLQWLLPEWGLAILPATAARFDSAPVAAAAPGPSGGLAILWLMGSVATLVAFLVGRARVRWIARRAAPVDHGPWAALLLQVSGEIGLIKPDLAIYEKHTRDFGLSPAHTLFIDDAPANVEGARLAGWNAVQFTDPEKLKADLAAHGIAL